MVMNHEQEFRPGGRAAPHLRRHNRALVLELARTRGKVSRAELSRVSGLSIPAVMEIVSGLKKEGLSRQRRGGGESIQRNAKGPRRSEGLSHTRPEAY